MTDAKRAWTTEEAEGFILTWLDPPAPQQARERLTWLLRAAETRGREAERARTEQLENALAGMLESYDLLIGSQSPFEAGSTAWGVIVGVFLDEPSRARSILGSPAPAGEEE